MQHISVLLMLMHVAQYSGYCGWNDQSTGAIAEFALRD